jgi:hypothetical protein
MNPNEPASQMTTRTKIAAMAMQGMLASGQWTYKIDDNGEEQPWFFVTDVFDDKGKKTTKKRLCFPESARVAADELLAELSATEFCEWKVTEDGRWDTSCDNSFEFTVDGLKENKFNHCPYCGKRIKEVK